MGSSWVRFDISKILSWGDNIDESRFYLNLAQGVSLFIAFCLALDELRDQ